MSSIFSPPKAPNPEKVAAAQSASNVDTAVAQTGLNAMNQTTPEGSLTYSQNGTWADGTPKFSSTQTLSPEQQAIYDQNAANSLQAGQIAGNQLGTVGDVLSTPFQLGATPQQAGVNLNQNLGLKNDLALNQNLGNQTNLGLNTQLGNQTNLNQNGNLGLNQNLGLNTNLGQNTNLGNNTNLSYSGAPSLDDSAVSDRINQLGSQRLDPRFAQEQQTLESNLANRGVVPGTEAYRRAMDQFGQTKNDAYNQLALQGQNQAFQEQATRRGVSTAETDSTFNAYNQNNQANQQFANDANLQNQDFANSAQAQNMGFQNTAQTANFNAANDANAANFNAFNQNNQANQQFANQGQQANFDAYNNANLQNQNFANSNNLAQTGFNNQAQAANVQFGNQATQQQAAFNNTAQTNNWQQGIQDQLIQRNQPINETTALMSGSQVSQPNYVNTPQTGIATTDVAGIQQQAYANQSAQYNAMMGGLAGIGGTAAQVALSDRRAKRDIKNLGSMGKGVNLYEFKYKPEFGMGGLAHIGVMADEVAHIPGAVVETDSAFKAVDYARVLEDMGA